MNTNASNSEILQIVEAVSREKGVTKDQLIDALEQAVQVAGKKKYGQEHNIKAEINKKTGEIQLFRVLDVVEEPEDLLTQISFDDAKEKKLDVQIGDQIYELLPPIDLGRVAAQTAKKVIIQCVGDAERQKQYEDFKDKKGEILNGTVKRIEFGSIIVDLGGRAEAIIKKEELIRGENFKINDRIKAYVQDVKRERKGPQIFLSRTDNNMIVKLFEMEVPEIYDGIIEIKGVARDPGSKTKIAIFAVDSSVDPVGSCVGIRGSRVKAVSNELCGEKIDIVLWNKTVSQFVINAMAPAEISKIVIDEVKHKVDVIVAKDQLSIAIGRRGQNVRLASKLTGWNIDLMTEEDESKRRSEEFSSTTKLFMELLNVEEVIAQLLSVEGFTTLDQIAETDDDVLQSIEGFDENLAYEVKSRAIKYVSAKNEQIIEKLEQLGVEQELIDILPVSPENILKLAEYGIKTIEDLGELTLREFNELIPNSGISDSDIEELIRNAKTL